MDSLTTRTDRLPLRPDYAAVHETWAVEMPMALDPRRFEAALRQVVAASDGLRTRVQIGPAGTAISSTVVPALDFTFEQHDLSGRGDPDSAFRGWLQRRVQRPLPLSQRSFDTVLVRLGKRRWMWVLIRHRVMAGRPPLEALLRALRDAYETGRLEQAVAVAAAPSPAPWPPDRQGGGALYGRAAETLVSQVARHFVWLGPHRTRGLEAMGPLADTLLALLAAFLSRVGPQKTVLVGRYHDGRGWAPVSVTIDRDDTFASLRQRIAEEQPPVLVGDVPPNGFDGALIMLPAPGCLEGRPLRIHRLASSVARAPVTLYAHAEQSMRGCGLELEFSRTLDEAERLRAVTHLLKLADEVLRAPGEPLATLDIVTPA